MDIADDFGEGLLSVDVTDVVAFLPELLARSSQLARSDLLDGFEELGQQDLRRLIDKQVNMLWHQDVGVNARMMPCMRLFQNGLDRLSGSRLFEQR